MGPDVFPQPFSVNTMEYNAMSEFTRRIPPGFDCSINGLLGLRFSECSGISGARSTSLRRRNSLG